MHSANHWGGAFNIHGDEDDNRSSNTDLDRAALYPHLDEVQQSWLLDPPEKSLKKKKYVDFGCIACSYQVVWWTLAGLVLAFLVIALPIIITKTGSHKEDRPRPPDNYTQALKTALLFFNAQKSGKLPKDNNVTWRGYSGLHDGLSDGKETLVGGYYDAGDNIKFHFPMAFSMTMLSWSVIEYPHKYQAVEEYDHIRDIIKWGTDYILLTFNSSAKAIDHVYSQVGGSRPNSTTRDDHTCWQRPEEMVYPRPVQISTQAPDLAAEMAAALASASIVFQDDPKYSNKLVNGAKLLYEFSVDRGRRQRYSHNEYIEPYYPSTSYWDEHMWSAAWMFYATGNSSYYLKRATNSELAKENAKLTNTSSDLRVLSWDNKLPAVALLLTRLRILLGLGYPYEEMLRVYQSAVDLNMCSYLRQYNVFNWTTGGLIVLNHGGPQPLQYVANSAFLASLYVDYMSSINIPGWNCGENFITSQELRRFATSQVNYILGDNPAKTSYLVGYGRKYPKHVHHRGASIPRPKEMNGTTYGCKEGWKWFNTGKPNPNEITGAMVGGPYKSDKFKDDRKDYNSTEPTLAGNAGLVAALVSLTNSGGNRVEKNMIFTNIPSFFPESPPPPSPWKPGG